MNNGKIWSASSQLTQADDEQYKHYANMDVSTQFYETTNLIVGKIAVIGSLYHIKTNSIGKQIISCHACITKNLMTARLVRLSSYTQLVTVFGYWIKYLFNNIEAAVLKSHFYPPKNLVDRNPENSIFLSFLLYQFLAEKS